MMSPEGSRLRSLMPVRDGVWWEAQVLLERDVARTSASMKCSPRKDNAIVRKSLGGIVSRGKWGRVNTFIYDRVCRFAPKLPASAVCRKQIKKFYVDKFHGIRHSKKCQYKCKAGNQAARDLRGVNTSICEQVFSHMRRLKFFLNEMSPERHRVLLLHYVGIHNRNILRGNTRYLNPCPHLPSNSSGATTEKEGSALPP